MVDLEQQLETVPLLAGLERKTRKRLSEVGKRRSYAAGDEIVKQGTTGTALYIILSGRATVLVDGATVGELSTGDFFGELALIEQHPRTASVQAVEDTECLLFPAWEFMALLEEHPEVAVPIMKALIARLHRSERHVSS